MGRPTVRLLFHRACDSDVLDPCVCCGAVVPFIKTPELIWIVETQESWQFVGANFSCMNIWLSGCSGIAFTGSKVQFFSKVPTLFIPHWKEEELCLLIQESRHRYVMWQINDKNPTVAAFAARSYRNATVSSHLRSSPESLVALRGWTAKWCQKAW